jgi:hypothetical protein
VLGDARYESLARTGGAMGNAQIVGYALDQIAGAQSQAN